MPDRPAHLHGQALGGDLAQARAGLRQPGVPASRAQSKGAGLGLLKQCAPRHPGCPVIAGERRRGRRGDARVRQQRLERPACNEHRSGVDDVLTGRPEMHVRRDLLADLLPQRRDDRDHRRSGLRGGSRDRREVEALGAACVRDRARRRCIDQTLVGAGLRERFLDIEHCR